METLLRRYPNLGPARILDALSFAYDNQELVQADIDREQAMFEKQGGPTVGARPLSQLSLPFDDELPKPVPIASMPERIVVREEEEPPHARSKSTRKK